MATVLKQSTQIKVRVGPFVDVGDGFTPETGIALGSADEAELLKANGAATVDISGATWAAVTGADGWYDLTLTASHTDTVGELVVVVGDDSVCLPVYQRFQVVEEAVYDMLYGASALGYVANAPVNVAQISGDGPAADNAESFFDGNGYAGTGNVIPTVTTLTNKTGFSLAATGLDSIAATDPGGVADTFPKMLVQLWRRFFVKTTLTATELKTYADNGTDVRTTQAVSDNGTTQTVDTAS